MQLLDELKKPVTLPAGKDPTMYLILAIFLGAYGVHNFWAGNKEKAKAQLLVTVISFCLCCLAPVSWYVWYTAIMDALNAKKAAQA